ncbi:hypothetical protein ACFOGJ_29815 [Marinibaculum pumilum]|uniref:Uncharacterized protein n=1 Tax=Marinibaculum pumilum TaxID=1766165 RepID=A0ABV7L9Y1_9PROT
MTLRFPPPLSCLLLAAGMPVLLAGIAPALAQDKCAPESISSTVEERMKADSKTPEEIADILSSGFKRRVLAGRIEDASKCSSDAVNAALDLLAKKYD